MTAAKKTGLWTFLRGTIVIVVLLNSSVSSLDLHLFRKLCFANSNSNHQWKIQDKFLSPTHLYNLFHTPIVDCLLVLQHCLAS